MIKNIFIFVILTAFVTTAYCQTADTVVLKQGLAINLKRGQERKVISPNPVAAAVETGTWEEPSENDKVEVNGQVLGTWKKIEADEAGWVNDDSLYNGYVYYKYNSPREQTVLLEGMGHNMVYVNGAPRSGNVYSYKDVYDEWEPKFDYSLIPVKLKKGDNEFLFEWGRGLLKVKLHLIKEGLLLNTKDLTTPDLLTGQAADTYGALPIINATEKSYAGLVLKTWTEGSEPALYNVNTIQPLSIYKSPFFIKLPAQQNAGTVKLNIQLINKNGGKEEVLASETINLRIVNPGDNHKETFISAMDGSVQYYAVNPPVDLKTKPALFLSLHGAGVEAINQANAYSHKNWGYIVCPTNRRPYGFNWENWGRMDGLEVYNIAMKKFDIDANRVYLTGHSMGGHGTWQLGINYSDKFAVLGPSAGWISIWGYRIGPREDSSATTKMLMRSTKHSDTYAFTTNLKYNGIYIIHGSADDNVPPQQAKSIMDNLTKIHKDFIYYEEPGAGHWWDKNEAEPGADCVDWLPLFDFFSHYAVPGKDRVKTIDFVTANPAVSSKNNWIEIINQVEQQKLSSVKIEVFSYSRKFTGTTDNIEQLQIDASILPAGSPVSVQLDGQDINNINIPADNIISLRKQDGKWAVADKFSKSNKNPVRCGNFREVLNYDVVFVYGTHGSKDENKWAYEKARYDAERLWYQGNGSIELVKDDDFTTAKYKDRSVILYGNSESNSAWDLLLKDSPVQVNNKSIKIGSKEYKGDDLACLMIRPRKDSDAASVAVVSGTGAEGMRLSDFALFHHPYINFPDITVYNSGILKSDEDGVIFSGYFGNDWSLEKGEFLNKD